MKVYNITNKDNKNYISYSDIRLSIR